VAKVLRRGLSERGALATNELHNRLGSTFLSGLYTHFVRTPSGPAKAVQRKRCRCGQGRLFFAPLSFGDAKESGSPTAKAFKHFTCITVRYPK